MMRILFVDDERDVLDGIRRNLHSMRSEWSLEFASSGVEALALLEKSPVDVIISDMRMPGMDGWQLLAEVKRRHPETVRFILSGQADPGSVMRTIGTAHQYLAKPCDAATIKRVIAQAQQLRQMLNDNRLAALVGRVGMLPSPPRAFQEILACIRQPTASIAEAARIIARDAAMTANIMKLVNSAFFGARRPVATAERAVAYLGLDTLGTLVLGHSLFLGGASVGIKGFSLERLWDHSLRTATTARSIALFEKYSALKVEEAFLAGMLHDVGKVVFATAIPTVTDDSIEISDDIEAQMNAHHAGVGAYLLGLWGFPNSIVEAVAMHHQPSRASGTEFGLAGLIHISDRLAHLQDTPGALPTDLGIEPDYLEQRGLSEQIPAWSAVVNASAGEPVP
jgi:putative nucleotidyltransferase with HDIG domain